MGMSHETVSTTWAEVASGNCTLQSVGNMMFHVCVGAPNEDAYFKELLNEPTSYNFNQPVFLRVGTIGATCSVVVAQ